MPIMMIVVVFERVHSLRWNSSGMAGTSGVLAGLESCEGLAWKA